MNNFIKNKIKTMLPVLIKGEFILLIQYLYYGNYEDTVKGTIERFEDFDYNLDIKTILYVLALDKIEQAFDPMSLSDNGVLDEMYDINNLYGDNDTAVIKNFISVLYNLEDDNDIDDKYNYLFEIMEEEMGGVPRDLADIIENILEIDDSEFSYYRDGLYGEFERAIKEYIQENYNDVLNSLGQGAKEFVIDLSSDKEDEDDDVKDSFNEFDWGF